MAAVSPTTTPVAWSIMIAQPIVAAGWMSTPVTWLALAWRKRPR